MGRNAAKISFGFSLPFFMYLSGFDLFNMSHFSYILLIPTPDILCSGNPEGISYQTPY